MGNRGFVILLLFSLCFGRIQMLFFGLGTGCSRDKCNQSYEDCYGSYTYDDCGCQHCSPVKPRLKQEGELCGTTLYPERECDVGLRCMTPVTLFMCRYSSKALSGLCVRVKGFQRSSTPPIFN